jgi:hypothetical protein
MKMTSKITNRARTRVKVRSAIRGGKITTNHSRPGLRVRSAVRAGKIAVNHNRRAL